METILVTGGTGFLGSNLVNRLVSLGYRVRVFSRKASEHTRNPLVEMVAGDIRDLKALVQAADGVDRVIHLVSNFRSGGSDKRDAYSVNVEGTENILKIAEMQRVKQLVHCSTIGVHGNVLVIPANEESPFNPGDLYQKTKLEAEKKVFEFMQKSEVATTIIRPISMLGPGDMRMLKLFRMIKKGRFVVVGNGRPYFQPAYIDDVVNGFTICLGNKAAAGNIFIIGGNEFLPLNDLFRMIAEELDAKPPSLRIPLTPVLWLASICEFLFIPLKIEPPLHRRRVSFFQNNRAFSIDKAKRVLGYRPQVTLRDAIRRTIHWYQENGYL